MRLLTTAYSDTRTVIEAINQGHVWQYIAKPWNEAELKAIFARVLESQALERRHRESIAELRARVTRQEQIRRSLQKYAPAAVVDELLASGNPEPGAAVSSSQACSCGLPARPGCGKLSSPVRHRTWSRRFSRQANPIPSETPPLRTTALRGGHRGPPLRHGFFPE